MILSLVLSRSSFRPYNLRTSSAYDPRPPYISIPIIQTHGYLDGQVGCTSVTGRKRHEHRLMAHPRSLLPNDEGNSFDQVQSFELLLDNPSRAMSSNDGVVILTRTEDRFWSR